MKIGELSKSTKVSIRSLRYYEQKGLISPERQLNGYREYHKLAAQQVETIQFYLSLGLSTEQIASFLQCVLINKEAFCKEILPIYKQKLSEIEDQIQTLTQMKSNLKERIASIQTEQQHKKEAEQHGSEKYQ